MADLALQDRVVAERASEETCQSARMWLGLAAQESPAKLAGVPEASAERELVGESAEAPAWVLVVDLGAEPDGVAARVKTKSTESWVR